MLTEYTWLSFSLGGRLGSSGDRLEGVSLVQSRSLQDTPCGHLFAQSHAPFSLPDPQIW